MTPGNLTRLIAHPERPCLVRGEIWITSLILSAAGFTEGPEGVIALASSLGADLCFVHISESTTSSELKEIGKIARAAGLDCAFTMDGPFQRLTLSGSLFPVLEEMQRCPRRFESRLAEEMDVIREILNVNASGMSELAVIGEDLGYMGGLYFSAETFRKLLLPFYWDLLKRFASSGICAGWHSDGAVTPLLPDLVKCGFRFFSLEEEAVDILRFKKEHGSRVTLIGGLRTEWLISKDLDPDGKIKHLESIKALSREGGLVLSSSCGLYDPAFIPVLKEIYRSIDGNLLC